MSTIEQHAHSHSHRGTFAEGVAMLDKYAAEDHVGTFAQGEAMPDKYAGEDHVGSFADGQAGSQAGPSSAESPGEPGVASNGSMP